MFERVYKPSGGQPPRAAGVVAMKRRANGPRHLAALALCLFGALALTTFGVVATPARAGEALSLNYAEASFTFPLIIDNPYWPLNPDGVQRTFTYVSETDDGCVVETTRVDGGGPYKVLTAAPYTGDMAVQAEDIGYLDENCDGTLVKTEDTYDWYREDDSGNIWYVGELSLDYEIPGCGDTSISPSAADMAARPACYAGSWEAGKGDEFPAEPGIVVPSDDPKGTGEPLTNSTYYMQEFADNAMDAAKIIKLDTNVKYKSDGDTVVYHHCRVTKEYSASERGAIEHKSYCPEDDGLVVIRELSGGKTELVTLSDIDPGL